MHQHRAIASLLFVAILFVSPRVAIAGNPVSPFTPSQNVQDPGLTSTVWGGCGPADSNCYLDAANTFATVTTGSLSNTGNTALGDTTSDTTTITGILDLLNATIKGALALVFEGATTNGITTKIAVTDPTANRTITLPDASGTVLLSGGSASFNPLTSTGTTDLQGPVSNSTGNLSLNDNTDITGNLMVSGSTTTAGPTNANGGLAVSGGNLTVLANNNITQSGTGTFSTGTGAVSLNGTTTIAGNTSISGASTFTVGTGASTFGGPVTITPFSTVGIVHNSAAGLLSTSLIVNADVAAGAAIAYSKLNLAGSIVTGDITDGTIALADLASDSVNSAKIVDASITGADIAASTIVNSNIANGTIDLTTKVTGILPDANVTDALTIAAGTVNNTPIGATTASTGAFTTLSNSGNATLATGASTTNIFGTGAGAANTIGNATGSNTINGATTFGNTVTFSTAPSLPLNSGFLYIGNGSNLAAAVALSGDATISNSGVLTIGTGAITTAKILDGTIALADLASDSVNSAKVVDGSIANVDIANSTIDLTTKVTGALPVANGGTGGTTPASARSGIGAAASGVNSDITSLTALSSITLPASSVASSQITDGAIVDADVNAAANIALSKLASGSSIITSLTTPSGTNANGGSISSNVLTFSLADASNPGLLSTSAQTIAGAKTFTSAVTGNAFIPTSSTAPTNGLYLPAGNALALSTNSAERIRIDSSGNVGIGTTSPGSALDVKGTLRLSGSTSGFVGFAPAAAAGSTTYTLPSADGTNGQALTTDGSGTLSWSSSASGSTEGLLVYSAGTQSIPNAVSTTITDLTNVTQNDFGAGSLSGGAFTVPSGKAGWYTITGLYSPPTPGLNGAATQILVNGTLISRAIAGSGNSSSNSQPATISKYLNVGDVVTIQGAQYSGAADTTSPFPYTSLSLVRLASTATSVQFGGLQNATSTNTADNTTLAQTWNWSTATTQNALSLSADAITTGRGLKVTSSSVDLIGALATVESTGNSTQVNGTSLEVGMTGATSVGTALNVTMGGTGVALRVNDDGTYTDSTPFVIDGSGNVGIGTASPAYQLQVVGSNPGIAATRIQGVTTVGQSYGLHISAGTNSSDIPFLIRNAGETLNLMYMKGDGALVLGQYGAGTLTTDGSGNVTASSDERLKAIDGSFSRGLSDVLKLKPITFHWNALSGMDTANSYSGFSAQNVQSAIPEAIATDMRGYLTLSDRPILAALSNSIKEIASITSLFRDNLIAWLGSDDNGITSVFAHHFIGDDATLQKLCVGDSANDNSPVCVTKSQLSALISGSSFASTSSQPEPTPETSPAPDPVPEAGSTQSAPPGNSDPAPVDPAPTPAPTPVPETPPQPAE